MAQELFRNARLKIKRANQHIIELNNTIAAFVQTDFYRLTSEKYPPSGGYVLALSYVTPPPPDLGLIVGEAIHAMRSSLDLMMWDLVSLCGGTPNEHLYFPITKTRQKLIDTLKDREIQTLGNSLLSFVCDVIKPYSGGNDPLCSLHALDNIDKHRLLIPLFSVAEVVGFSGRAGNSFYAECTIGVGENGKCLGFGADNPFEVEDYGTPVVNVVFGKDQPFQDQPIIPTLHGLAQLVSSIVDNIERAYLART